MATNDKTVLITGATGKQGGAVARHLVNKGFALRAMTRKPDSDAGKALAARGIEVVAGDLDDATSLKAALRGAWGVFGVQNTWEAGVVKEEEQGKRLAQLAREAGVEHYVYTSVGSAERKTGIPHFDNKARVEETVRSLGFPSHVILRPVFFMENLPSPWFLHGDKLISSLAPTTVLQMIASDDIGKIAARAFTHAKELAGKAFELAGDAATLPQAAALLGKALGKNVEYLQIPVSEIRKNSEDMALMLEWFDRVGYAANIPALESTFDLRLTKLDAWVQANVRA